MFPRLEQTVWVGVSAGSMVMTPRIGTEFVDFSIFPHLDYPDFPENTLAHAERWAEQLDGPAYAIDDQTAIRVDDGVVEVISEGHWKRLA